MPDNKNRPLAGKRIVVTRPYEQQEELVNLLSSFGAEPVRFPVIAIVPPDNWEEADRAIENLTGYEWIIFTSVNGVQSFIGRLIELNRDIKKTLYGIKICAVGLKTADAIEKYGLDVDFVPEEFRAEAVIEGFRDMGNRGERVLIPRAQLGREVLPDELARMGMKVSIVPVYKAVRPDIDVSGLKEMLKKKEIDVVTFTSGSCVRNFLEIIGLNEYEILLAGVRIACISPVTADTARKYGLTPDIVPDRYTVADLTKAIVKHYNKKRHGAN